MVSLLLNLLKQNCGKEDSENVQILIGSCRSLGNLCFENNLGQKYVIDNDGVDIIIKVLQFSIFLPWNDLSCLLRSVCTGLLLNLLTDQEQLYSKVLELGTLDTLSSILENGVQNKDSEQAAMHCMIIINFLTESTPDDLLMTERLCKAVVKILEQSTLGELSELCVELLHSQAANDCVGLYLARAGLGELLMSLLDKHRPAVYDDELRNLMKMACDVLIHILNGDEAMLLLFADGKGKVFQGMMEWLDSTDEYMMSTAILAMANFAHNDKHSIQLVKLGVAKKLLNILSRNNTSEADIRLQHALLSGLRNLVIPSENKPVVLEEGLLDVILPMTNIPTYPVVFNLLPTLRIVINGQENTACKLGTNSDLIYKVVEWTKTEDHLGVQAEACRLLAWIIKNSRDREVMGVMVQCGAVQPLVNMITSEHQVMQTEALLSISLITIMRLADAEQSLLESRIGEQLNELLTRNVPREIFSNILTLVGQLMSSNELKAHLREVAINRALSTFVSSNDKFIDLRDHVARLSSMLGLDSY
ncbi:hypothetical protein M8J76_013456 [Diaphorina citri]|nr:hypothetical protein M8J75_001549 [Diaphorina citri]KAI5727058.1 hypothetical protein M8J76_013456 [Diaphorina citri]KAI5732396.1 hypothetical protein M8J77_026215 [Diaphorina citri]